MKIVINGTFGGFHIDRKLARKMYELGCRAPELVTDIEKDEKYDYWHGVPRNNKYLVEAVEFFATKGTPRLGWYEDLRVVDVDTARPWYLDEYDGYEGVRYFDANDHGCNLEQMLLYCDECGYFDTHHRKSCSQAKLPKLVWRKGDRSYHTVLTDKPLDTDLPFEYFKT